MAKNIKEKKETIRRRATDRTKRFLNFPDLEDGCSKLFPNVGTYLPICAMNYTRKPKSSTAAL